MFHVASHTSRFAFLVSGFVLVLTIGDLCSVLVWLTFPFADPG
jgi:hypothetical protein